ncbi:MAG: hypothetical protein QG656_2472 [Candidatus Hydrogenedentes bacterium]|nr:hypothetical protein [Candidatus Hydrogenedentota bacterium]
MNEAVLTAERVLLHLAAIEETGERFYQGLYDGTQSAWVRRLAEVMVRAEQRHRTRFLEYAERAAQSSRLEDNALSGVPPAEAVRLLRVGVFAEEDRSRKAAQYASDAEVIRVAIGAEERLALLLTQLREFVPKMQRRFIDRVIKEEWAHKDKLERAMQKHFGMT